MINFVGANGVGVGPGVEILADLAQKTPVGCEFQQLRGGGSVGGSGGAAAGEDENVPFRIDRNPRHFAQIDVRRQPDEVGNGLIGDFGHRRGGLAESGGAETSE